MEKKFQRILIIRTDRIGDVILTLPMARVLKEKIPDARLAMLIQRYTSELIENNNDIDQVICYDRNDKPVPLFEMVNTIRSRGFDFVFHTHPRFRLALITWLAGIPVRVGTGYRWYSFFFNRKVFEHRKSVKRHELEYNLNLLDAIGCSAEGIDIKPSIRVTEDVAGNVRMILRDSGVTEGDRLVIVHPGSGRSARDWNPKSFGLLARLLGRLPGVKVVITGGTHERTLVNLVVSFAGEGIIPLIGVVNLIEYCALAKSASLFIANSTGPLHIAAAVGTPVIGLYPHIPVLSAARWGPYTEKKTIISPTGKPPDCKKCLRSPDNRCECMDTITVEEVFGAAVKYLTNGFS